MIFMNNYRFGIYELKFIDEQMVNCNHYVKAPVFPIKSCGFVKFQMDDFGAHLELENPRQSVKHRL